MVIYYSFKSHFITLLDQSREVIVLGTTFREWYIITIIKTIHYLRMNIFFSQGTLPRDGTVWAITLNIHFCDWPCSSPRTILLHFSCLKSLRKKINKAPVVTVICHHLNRTQILFLRWGGLEWLKHWNNGKHNLINVSWISLNSICSSIRKCHFLVLRIFSFFLSHLIQSYVGFSVVFTTDAHFAILNHSGQSFL